MRSLDFTGHCVLFSWAAFDILFAGKFAFAQPVATLFGLEAVEANFLTATTGDISTSVGSDGKITVIGQSVTDGFTDHGTFKATWVESSDGVVFRATGTNYAEFMTCSINPTENNAACSFSNSVSGQGTFTGTFEPTSVPVVALLSNSVAQPTATSVSPSPSASPRSSAQQPLATGVAKGQLVTITFPSQSAPSNPDTQQLPTSLPLPNPSQPLTLFGLDAAEADFLTASSGNRATSVGIDGVIAVVGKGVTDAFVDHGTFDAVWQESSNGVVFQATGDVYSEFMTCSVNQPAGSASCSFVNSVSGQGAFSGTFQPTSLAFIATVTPNAGSSSTATGALPQDTQSAPAQTGQPSATTAAPQGTITAPPNPSGPFTLFSLAAAEAAFLTQNGVDKSTIVGPDGIITVIGKGVTDDFVDHGTFTATWVESSNGVEFHATGDIYNEFMTCSVDQAAGLAGCSFSNSVGTQGFFSGTFEPTAIQVLATLTPGTVAAAATTLATEGPPSPAIVSPTFIQGGPSSPTDGLATIQGGVATSGFMTLPAPQPSDTDQGGDITQNVNGNNPPGSSAVSLSPPKRVLWCGIITGITAMVVML